MDNTLEEFLSTNTEMVISGLEGSSKTRSVIKWIYENTNFKNREIILIACKSYVMMKEKQQEIMKRFNLTEHEVQIIGVRNEEYTEFHTNKEDPDKLYPEVKIVLCSQKYICKCKHHYLDIEKRLDKHFIKTIIVDEFDMNVGIIPSLHYILQDYTHDAVFKNDKMNKKDLITFLKTNYSPYDYAKIEKCQKEDIDDFFISYWIEYNRSHNIKTIFCSSELLARTLLEEIGFSSFEMQYKEFDHNVHFYPSLINNHFFKRINQTNKWNIFGFNTIISDKCDQSILKENKVDINIVNHATARGSNSFAGEDILTILSYIPAEAITKIYKVLKYFNPLSEYTPEIVEKLFYRDKLCQAVGRVIGYRGEWKEKKNTWLLVNSHLWSKISEALYSDNYKFPYNLIKWDFKNEEFESLLNDVKEDGRIKKCEVNSNSLRKTITNISNFNSKLDLLFEKDDNSFILYEDVKNELLKIQQFEITQPIKVANYFGCETKSTSIRVNGKVTGIKKIIGLRLKQPVK